MFNPFGAGGMDVFSSSGFAGGYSHLVPSGHMAEIPSIKPGNVLKGLNTNNHGCNLCKRTKDEQSDVLKGLNMNNHGCSPWKGEARGKA